jgi:hypothetical protein
MNVHLIDSSVPAKDQRTHCGKKRWEVRPDKIIDPNKKNAKTIINQMRKAGKTVTLCVYCTKWADVAFINSIDL